MNRLKSRSTSPPPAEPPSPAAANTVARLRRVHRAASDLRRGIPVVLTAGGTMIAMLAAEAADADNVAELAALAVDAPLLLLAPTRAAAVLRRPVAHGEVAVAVRVPSRCWCRSRCAPLPNPRPSRCRRSAWASRCRCRRWPARLWGWASWRCCCRRSWSLCCVPACGRSLDRRHLMVLPAADVAEYPAAAAVALRQVAAARVPLEDAPDARVIAFRSEGAGLDHLAIVVGEPEKVDAPLVRIHSECFTGDLLGSLRCDCGQQLRGAIRRMAEEGAGVLLYLAQEGRGIGLINKLRAYTLQDRGLDTLDANRALGWDADERNFLIAARMLEALGTARIRLLTNNPDKLTALAACGVEIVGREPHSFAPNGVNDEYLATKAARFGHLLD